ncbi:ABC transporter permease [Streptomyces sp. NPDC000594]|uniref:ABC transporter permease n=1 Tax=Streptomyces sp. NPDC000594 TaxID=3154261 RepID=UPI003322EC0A
MTATVPAARDAAAPGGHDLLPGARAAAGGGAVLDNRPSYLAFGLAWLIGHGAAALAHGADPLVPMPSALPQFLLVGGLLAATVTTGAVAARAGRGVTGGAALTAHLLTGGWAVGFGSLFLLITALSGALDEGVVHTLMWPAASGLVVGLLYLAGGAVHRDLLQYGLGCWLALTSTAALFLDRPGLYAALALAGGGSYLVAAALEPRRRAAALVPHPVAARVPAA